MQKVEANHPTTEILLFISLTIIERHLRKETKEIDSLEGCSVWAERLLRAVLFPPLLSSYHGFAVNTRHCSVERADRSSTESIDPDRENAVLPGSLSDRSEITGAWPPLLTVTQKWRPRMQCHRGRNKSSCWVKNQKNTNY